MTSEAFIKYPKTSHIAEFADTQGGLSALVQAGNYFVIEEKMDGTQVGISFDHKNRLQIQSRGQYVSSEPEFSMLKNWCWEHSNELLNLLGNRYILFGEWLFAKHTMFYDSLPNYLMEFDIYDRVSSVFLSTKARRAILAEFSFISSVNVLEIREQATISELEQLIGKSSFTSECAFDKLSDREKDHTDSSGFMEGLYIKVENDQEVVGRYKLVRSEFIEKIRKGEMHWKSRRITKNIVKVSITS